MLHNKKAIVFLIIFSLLIIGLSSAYFVYAENKYDASIKAFFDSLEQKDYGILMPYLSSEMKKAFNEKDFNAFISSLSDAGELTGYNFVRKESFKNFYIYYYEAVFQKKIITFKLVLDKDTGLISGIWIVGVKENSVVSSFGFLFPMIGGLLGLITIYLLLKRVGWAEIILGIILVVITLSVQPLFQQLPFLASGIKSNADVVEKGIGFIIITSIWMGGIAGVFQESLKYFLSRRKPLTEALYIGVGFGLGEAILLPLVAVFLALIKQSILPLSAGSTSMLLGLLERYIALLFHASTTLAFAYYYVRKKGKQILLYMILAHSVIDALAVYYQLVHSMYVLVLSYAGLIIISVLLLYKLIPAASEEKYEELGPRW